MFYEGQQPPRTEGEWLRYRAMQDLEKRELEQRGTDKRYPVGVLDTRRVQEADLDPNRTVADPALELEQVNGAKPAPNLLPVIVAGAIAFVALR